MKQSDAKRPTDRPPRGGFKVRENEFGATTTLPSKDENSDDQGDDTCERPRDRNRLGRIRKLSLSGRGPSDYLHPTKEATSFRAQ